MSAWSALLSSFAEVRQVVLEQGVKLDVKGVRRVAYRYAERARVLQQAEQIALAEGDNVQRRRGVVSADGGRLGLRENKRGAKTKKGRTRYRGAWREPMTRRVSSMRAFLMLLLSIAGLSQALTAAAQPIRIATWNLNNLHYITGEPLRSEAPARSEKDYALLQEYRAPIAVRRGVFDAVTKRDYPDLSVKHTDGRPVRWGTELLVERHGKSLRLLSIHLKSGCSQGRLDTPATDSCITLAKQRVPLKAGLMPGQPSASPSSKWDTRC